MRYFFILSIILSFSANTYSANKASEWYGFLTIDKYPFENCKITDILAVSEIFHIDNHSGEYAARVLKQQETILKNKLKNQGWQGMLGYQVSQVGGKYASGVSRTIVISSAIHLSGVAFKVSCK